MKKIGGIRKKTGRLGVMESTRLIGRIKKIKSNK